MTLGAIAGVLAFCVLVWIAVWEFVGWWKRGL